MSTAVVCHHRVSLLLTALKFIRIRCIVDTRQSSLHFQSSPAFQQNTCALILLLLLSLLGRLAVSCVECTCHIHCAS